MRGRVVSVARDDGHRFSKPVAASIRLLAGLGVEGDAHCGETVKHRSRVAADPTQPNLRQVHLIQAELFDELAAKGFALGPGDLGENVLTAGLDLLALPRGARLRLGPEAVVEVTGLRNPCAQIDGFRRGLLAAVLDRAADGSLVRKAGIMGVVIAGGDVRPEDPIEVVLPSEPWSKLERV
ncbi:MAG: MOSC domain-containing protein [Hyphomicrobiales bacterium]|nr:MOSC domain-containing protein [Hyphomicrobiales bacterium]